MIVDRTHQIAATVRHCGACGRAIAVDDPYGEVRVAGMARPLIRCAACTQQMRADTAAVEARRLALVD